MQRASIFRVRVRVRVRVPIRIRKTRHGRGLGHRLGHDRLRLIQFFVKAMTLRAFCNFL